MGFYKRFYQIVEAAESDKFFRRVGIIVQKYKGPHQIIAVKAINYFMEHRILNVCIDITSNSYKHYVTNNFEKLRKEKDGSDNTFVIIIPILVRIGIYIGSTRFLDNGALDIVFSPDGKIQEESV